MRSGARDSQQPALAPYSTKRKTEAPWLWVLLPGSLWGLEPLKCGCLQITDSLAAGGGCPGCEISESSSSYIREGEEGPVPPPWDSIVLGSVRPL